MVALAESSDILCWGLSGKRVVRPMVVEFMGEGVDEGLQLIDSMRQIVDCIELISPGRWGAFDAALEVGALRRQHEEFQPARLAFGWLVGPDVHEERVDLHEFARGLFSWLRYLGIFVARRRDAARPFRITWQGRPITSMRGLLELVDSQLSASETPFFHSSPRLISF